MSRKEGPQIEIITLVLATYSRLVLSRVESREFLSFPKSSVLDTNLSASLWNCKDLYGRWYGEDS